MLCTPVTISAPMVLTEALIDRRLGGHAARTTTMALPDVISGGTPR
jgi:hypothetical protein